MRAKGRVRLFRGDLHAAPTPARRLKRSRHTQTIGAAVAGVLVALCLTAPRPASAQTSTGAETGSRIFVDVNLVGAADSVAHTRQFTSKFSAFSEIASTDSFYPEPARSTVFVPVDVGGGVMLTRFVGVGATYSRMRYENVVDLSATIPHPSFLRAPATGTATTNRALERKEDATHVFATWVVDPEAHVQIRFFGGPSFFSYRADMVENVSYAQSSGPLESQNQVAVDGFSTRSAKGSSVGWHVGGDVAYLVTGMIAVTAGLRYSDGTVTVDPEPLSGLSQEIRVGTTLGFVGVRVRFGG